MEAAGTLVSLRTLTEIEDAAGKLPVAQQQELLRFLTSRLVRGRETTAGGYRTRVHPGGVREGINADKLGQLPEDF
jgi:hypothetical protein